MSTTAAATSSSHSAVVPLKNVERELDRQLKEAQGPGESPILRARMSNLIIYSDSAEAASGIADIVPDLVEVHPARVILVVNPQHNGSEELQATVTTRVNKVGKGLRSFSEMITLQGSGPAARHLPFAVRRLLVGDIPTNLWWAAPVPPPMAGSILYDLAEQADQVIYDSFGWPEPARGMAATANWLRKFERSGTGGWYRVASDLTWRRLKAWRRIIGQALSPSSVPPTPPEALTDVLVEHGPHSVMIAWSLASWLTQYLGWRPRTVRVQPAVEIGWQLTSEHGNRSMRIRRLGDGPRGIRQVRIGFLIEGEPGALVITPEEDGRRLKITPEGAAGTNPRTIGVPEVALAELVGRQLSDREPDPVFRESMKVAQELAQTVLGTS